MLSLRTPDDMARALASPIDTGLRRLLALRRDQLDDEDAARFTIAEIGDTAADIEAGLGFPITVSLFDGSRVGDPEFTPYHDWAERHPGGWTEFVFIFSDDGPAEVLLVPDLPGIDATLLELCRQHA